MNKKTFKLILDLWSYINKKRKLQFVFLLILIIFSSFFEMLSIGAVFPFLLILSTPEVLFEYEILHRLFSYLGYEDPNETLLITTAFFCFSIMIAGIFRLTLLYFVNFLSYVTSADLGVIAVDKTLKQPYAVHTRRNSSELINSVVVKVNTVLQSVVLPGLTLISSILTALGILIVLSIVSFEISLTISVVLGLIYSLFIKFTKKTVLKNSKDIAIKSTKVVQTLQESFGGIRDIILDNAQSVHSKVYKKAELEFRLAQASNAFIGATPRFIIEPIGIILIATIAYLFSSGGTDNGIGSLVPILGALALGFQRLLPILQQTYASIISIRGSHNSLADVIFLLNQTIDNEYLVNQSDNNLVFEKTINLKNLNYKYENNGALILKNINLKILKASTLGIIGETGSGKSTLIDIIMGLLSPTSGLLEIDGKIIASNNLKLWRSKISHVPQSIFLLDSTIAENIALNISKDDIDMNLLEKVIIQAQLSKLINSWPEKLNTKIGERGIRLSGGQRQRIGIARALYKQSEVIVLDEATSALDNKTEKTIMNEISNLKLRPTVIIVAHRHSTLENCDQIIELKNSNIKFYKTEQFIKEIKNN